MAVGGIITVGAMIVGGVVKGVNSVKTANANARALNMQNAFQAQMNSVNQEVLQLSKDTVLQDGETEAARLRKQARQIVGTQQAAYASQGVAIDSGSAAEVTADTAYLAEIDALQVRNNALRSAFGITTQQIEGNLQTQITSAALQNQRKQTLVTGGMNALGAGLETIGSVSNYGYSSRGGALKVPARSKGLVN